MLVCVDTNVMLSALARGSALAPLFRAIGSGELPIAVSTSILLEYEEIAAQQGGPAFAAKIMAMLSLVAQVHDSIVLVHPKFHFNVVVSDADDNKFTDCAIAAHADFVITLDHDFAPLTTAGYKPQPIKPEEFIAKYLKR